MKGGRLLKYRAPGSAGGGTAATQYGEILIATGPSAYWPLNEVAGVIAYEMIAGSNGTFTNAPTLGEASPVIGSDEYAVSFDGVDDYIAASFVGPVGTASRSISAWLYRPTGEPSINNPMIVGYGGDSDGEWYGLMGSTTGAQDSILLYFGGNNYIAYSGVLDADTWVHVVATWDGATHKLYQNGTLQTAAATFGSMGLTTNDNPVYIGKSSSASWDFAKFNGRESDVAVWPIALSASQAASLYALALGGWDENDQMASEYTLTNNNRDASESDTNHHQLRGVNRIGNRKVYFELEMTAWGTNGSDVITGIADKESAYGVSWNTSDVQKIILYHQNAAYFYEDQAGSPIATAIDVLNGTNQVEFWAVDATTNSAWHGHADSSVAGWTGSGSPAAGINALSTTNTGFSDYAPYIASDNSSATENAIRLNEKLADLLYGLPVGFTTMYGETDGTSWGSPTWLNNSNWTVSSLNLSKSTAVYAQIQSGDRLPNFVYWEVEIDEDAGAIGQYAVGIQIGSTAFGADYSTVNGIYIIANPASGDNFQVWDGRTSTKLWEDSASLGRHAIKYNRLQFAFGGGCLWIGCDDNWYNSGNPSTGASPMVSGIEGAVYAYAASGNEAAALSLNFDYTVNEFLKSIPEGFTDLVGGFVSDYGLDRTTNSNWTLSNNGLSFSKTATGYKQARGSVPFPDNTQIELMITNYDVSGLVFGLIEEGTSFGASYSASSTVYFYESSSGTVKVMDGIDGGGELLSQAVTALTVYDVITMRREGGNLYFAINGSWLNSGAAIKTDLTDSVELFVGSDSSGNSISGRLITTASKLFFPLEAGCSAYDGTTDDNSTWLLHQGTGRDNSGNFYCDANKADVVNTTNLPTIQDTQAKFDDTSIYFSGGSQSIRHYLPAIGANDFTIEGWVYAEVSGGGTTVPRVLCSKQTINTANSHMISVGEDYLMYRADGTDDIEASVSFAAGWNHFAVTRLSGTVYLWGNGVALANRAYSNPIYAGIFHVGNFEASSPYFYTGYLASFRVVVGQAVYTGAFTPSATALTII